VRRSLFCLATAIVALHGEPAIAGPTETCLQLETFASPTATVITSVWRSDVAGPALSTDSPRQHEAKALGHCVVSGIVSSVTGSRIGFELWLPEAEVWNGRLRMYGNGGYSSSMPLAQMGAGLIAGAAVVATDTGHSGDDPSFAVGAPAAIDDWGHRAVHEVIVLSKQLVRAYYQRDAAYTYYEGCSTGGHQGLSEAQRYPDDFDGIVAGAPGSNRTRLNIGFLWQFVSNHAREAPHEAILPAAKLSLLTEHALRTCGTQREIDRGFLQDPFSCKPDLSLLACRVADESRCLMPREIAAARRLYEGARNPRTGEQIYPPPLPGSESAGPPGAALPGWSLYWADPQRPDRPARSNFFRFWVFEDPAWDWRTFDFDGDVDRALQKMSERIDATSADLRPFKQAGGRLLVYHGLNDAVVSPWDSLNYWNQVQSTMAADTGDFYRLFFVPGMGHCGGGPSLAAARLSNAIEAWVERDVAPDRLEALRPEQEGRPLLVLDIPAHSRAQ